VACSVNPPWGEQPNLAWIPCDITLEVHDFVWALNVRPRFRGGDVMLGSVLTPNRWHLTEHWHIHEFSTIS
jgi:hypothetical protein